MLNIIETLWNYFTRELLTTRRFQQWSGTSVQR